MKDKKKRQKPPPKDGGNLAARPQTLPGKLVNLPELGLGELPEIDVELPEINLDGVELKDSLEGLRLDEPELPARLLDPLSELKIEEPVFPEIKDPLVELQFEELDFQLEARPRELLEPPKRGKRYRRTRLFNAFK